MRDPKSETNVSRTGLIGLFKLTLIAGVSKEAERLTWIAPILSELGIDAEIFMMIS